MHDMLLHAALFLEKIEFPVSLSIIADENTAI